MKKILSTLFLSALLCTAYATVIDGINYTLDADNLTAEVNAKTSGYYRGAIEIPQTVTYQDNEYTVTAIGEKAFRQCSALTSVFLPSTITRIDKFAFAECTSLTTISLPAGVDFIGDYAFAHSGITHIITSGDMFAYMPESYSGAYTIPDTIKRICGAAFIGCSRLSSLTIHNQVEYIGYAAFSSCRSLTSIVIPNSVSYLGEYAFEECMSLTDVKLPDNLDTIRYCAFYQCASLPSVDIPASVRNVGRYAFCYCPSLVTVKSFATNPPQCGEYAFDQIGANPTLFVPHGCSSSYRSAAEWKNFAPRIYEMGGAAVGDAVNQGVQVFGSCGHIMIEGAEGESLAVYSADGKKVGSVDHAATVQKIDIPGSGVYFIRLANGETKRVVVK